MRVVGCQQGTPRSLYANARGRLISAAPASVTAALPGANKSRVARVSDAVPAADRALPGASKARRDRSATVSESALPGAMKPLPEGAPSLLLLPLLLPRCR